MRNAFVFFLTLIFLSVPVGAAAELKEAPVYSSHANSSNKIALTFDDGPHPKLTPEILEVLDKYGVSATFFVIGQNAELYSDIVKHEIDLGHEIGNHTFSHKGSIDRKYLREELERTHETVYETNEYSPKLFRPPEGRYDKKLKALAEVMDYSVVLWNIDTRDWAHTDADRIVSDVTAKVKSGDIILFHDYITGYSPTKEALERLIPALRERGFVFVTVSELLGSE